MNKKKENELLHDFATYAARILFCVEPEGLNVPYFTISMMSGRLEECVAHLKEVSDALCEKHDREKAG